MKNISLIFFITVLITSSQIWAGGQVRMNDESNPSVRARETANYITLIVDGGSGSGTSEDSAKSVYVPIRRTNATDNDVYSTISNTLPETTNNKGEIEFKVSTTGDANDPTYLFMAVKEGDDSYKIVEKDSGQPYYYVVVGAAEGEDLQIFTVEINQICAKMSETCSNLDILSTTNSKEDDFVYFFLHTDPNLSGSIKPSVKTDGFYYDLNLSNYIYENSNITLVDLIRGDTKVTVDFSGFTMADHYRTMAFMYNSLAPVVEDRPYQSSVAVGGSPKDLETTITSGRAVIDNLVNSQTVYVGIYYQDKYQFASLISNIKEQTPVEIEALLTKQACYIFSAGFGEEHFVTDFFQEFRDQVLLQYGWGRLFVDFYYASAPKYAHYVYQNPILSFSVRIIAYCLYFAIKFYYLLLAFATLLILPILYIILRQRRGSYKGSEVHYGRSQ